MLISGLSVRSAPSLPSLGGPSYGSLHLSSQTTNDVLATCANVGELNFITASILLHERYNAALAAGPLNAVERSAADFPAFRPKTAPEVRPLPPG